MKVKDIKYTSYQFRTTPATVVFARNCDMFVLSHPLPCLTYHPKPPDVDAGELRRKEENMGTAI